VTTDAAPRPDVAAPAVADTASRRLAINRLLARTKLDASAVDRFLARRTAPIVEGTRCTFLWRGEADEVVLHHSIFRFHGPVPLRRVDGTDLWYVIIDLPEGSRVEYQLEITRGGQHERFNDPLNPHRAHHPFGSTSVCFGHGYETPEWTQPASQKRNGTLEEIVLPSRALQRDCAVTVYRPAGFRRAARYPLLIVHDGGDYLKYAAAQTVLDNLIHRLDVAETIVAFVHPGDRLAEYSNSAAHARYLTAELVPRLEAEFPLAAGPSARCLMGASFGAVAALSAAYRYPDVYGSLLLQSGSFVFTDIGDDHGGGPAFEPVVRFVNRYRAAPRRVADRVFVSCGVYEPLIVRNRSMVPTFEAAGMAVRYVEARDGHSWENWRDRLREGLSWIFPGPQKFFYE
jgi:enterochelin esterase family protein